MAWKVKLSLKDGSTTQTVLWLLVHTWAVHIISKPSLMGLVELVNDKSSLNKDISAFYSRGALFKSWLRHGLIWDFLGFPQFHCTHAWIVPQIHRKHFRLHPLWLFISDYTLFLYAFWAINNMLESYINIWNYTDIEIKFWHRYCTLLEYMHNAFMNFHCSPEAIIKRCEIRITSQ